MERHTHKGCIGSLGHPSGNLYTTHQGETDHNTRSEHTTKKARVPARNSPFHEHGWRRRRRSSDGPRTEFRPWALEIWFGGRWATWRARSLVDQREGYRWPCREELPIGRADNNEPGAEAAESSVKPQLEVELKSERKLTELTSLCAPLMFWQTGSFMGPVGLNLALIWVIFTSFRGRGRGRRHKVRPIKC